MTDALAIREGALVEATPLPVFGGAAMVQALEAYRNLQASLDRAMPDQIMQLDGRPFRKKGYWRAVAVAFHLTVEPVSETREVNSQFDDGRENFGWIVSYKATAPNGRSVVGDGSCFAIEKARRFRCPHPESPGSRRTLHYPAESCPDYDPAFSWKALPPQATDHNIRSHAHTRAMNRAVSNLVGFGEVSAEEVDRDEHSASVPEKPKAAAAPPAASSPASAMPASDGRPVGAVLVKGSIGVKEGVSKKEGKPDRPWKKYTVAFDDGRTGSTFDQKIADLAVECEKHGRFVIPTITTTQNGDRTNVNLEKLEVVVAAEPKLPIVQEDKEPVGTPEKILMTRAVVTGQGKHWVIQSDKRQYTTDKEAIHDYADTARKVKAAVIIAFDAKPDAKGVIYNVVKAIEEVPATPSVLETELDEGPQEEVSA